MIEANPGVSPENPQPGTMLIVPSRYVLPNVPRVGIVINLAEMRLFYYVPLSKKIMSFPIGIGRLGWNTPIGKYKIIEKTKDPKWIAPESIRRWRAKQGVEIPKVWPAGPDNPLGQYAMRLSNPTYMIHGTNQPDGVGRRVSSGCIRLYPEDIEKLFKNVPMDTRVRLINQSYKAGFYRGHLMVESHLPLQESTKLISRSPSELVPIKKVIKGKKVKINWSKLFYSFSRSIRCATISWSVDSLRLI